MERTPDGFIVQTAAFSGTLQELAQALRTAQLGPHQLDVHSLVRDYLGYFERVAGNDLELASEALPLVARIVELKVRLLLPRAPKDAEDEEALVEEAIAAVTLLEDLEEAIRFLRFRRAERRVVLSAKAPRPDYPRAERPIRVGVERLQQLAARCRESAYFELALERFSMAAAMTSLLGRLRRLGRGRLDDLAEQRRWPVLTVTFAGMLELFKEGQLRARQGEPYGPIELELAETDERVEAA